MIISLNDYEIRKSVEYALEIDRNKRMSGVYKELDAPHLNPIYELKRAVAGEWAVH